MSTLNVGSVTGSDPVLYHFCVHLTLGGFRSDVIMFLIYPQVGIHWTGIHLNCSCFFSHQIILKAKINNC